jgi:hypothetical protein
MSRQIDELRQLIEIARLETEYALADLTFFNDPHSAGPINHVKGIIKRLDRVLMNRDQATEIIPVENVHMAGKGRSGIARRNLGSNFGIGNPWFEEKSRTRVELATDLVEEIGSDAISGRLKSLQLRHWKRDGRCQR